MRSVLSVPLKINLTYTGGDAASARVKETTEEFLSLGGQKFIEQLLHEAHLATGEWSLRVMKGIKPMRSSVRYSHIVISGNVIQMRLKSDKEAGYLISLRPRTDLGLSLATICTRLNDACARLTRKSAEPADRQAAGKVADKGEGRGADRGADAETAAAVSDDDVRQLVEAAAQLTFAQSGDAEEWFDDLLMEIGPAQQARRGHWDRTLREAVKRGLLKPSAPGYVVNDAPPEVAESAPAEVAAGEAIGEAVEEGFVEEDVTAEAGGRVAVEEHVQAPPVAAAAPITTSTETEVNQAPATSPAAPATSTSAPRLDVLDELISSPDLPLLLAELVDLGLARNAAKKAVAAANEELARAEAKIQAILSQVNPAVVRRLADHFDK